MRRGPWITLNLFLLSLAGIEYILFIVILFKFFIKFILCYINLSFYYIFVLMFINYAVEIGNEPDHYYIYDFRPYNYTWEEYRDEFAFYASEVN